MDLLQQPVPTTPTMATPRREGMMLCPVPQRPFQTPIPMLTPQGSASPNSARGEPRGDWWSDAEEAAEAGQELCSLLGGDAFRRWDKASFLVDGRPASAASTSAGPTPSPDSRGSPLRWSTPDPTIGDQSDNAGSAQLFQDGAGAGDSRGPASTSQSRKIFVGGVPQEMTQEDLRCMFNRFGDVKKAWLQKVRPDPSSAANPMQNHRGFGFVVFNDDGGMDQLLGEDFSRFLPLPDGRRMEVKRALSSSSMAHGAPPTRTTRPADRTPKLTPAAAAHDFLDNDWPARHAQRERAGFLAESRGGMRSQQAGGMPWPAPPPFPAIGVAPASWNAAAGHAFVPAQVTSFPNYAPAAMPVPSPVPAVQAQASASGAAAAAAAVPGAPYPCIGSIAQLLGNNKETLTRALMEAMPTHYDD